MGGVLSSLLPFQMSNHNTSKDFLPTGQIGIAAPDFIKLMNQIDVQAESNCFRIHRGTTHFRLFRC